MIPFYEHKVSKGIWCVLHGWMCKKRVSLPQISSIWHHLGKACTFHPCYVVNTTSSSIINLTVLASLWIKTVCVSYFKYINSITKGFIVKFSYIPEFLISWPSHLPLFPFCLLLILWLFSNSLALTLFSWLVPHTLDSKHILFLPESGIFHFTWSSPCAVTSIFFSFLIDNIPLWN